MVGEKGSATGKADETVSGTSGVPDSLRQAAETTLLQARQAVDQYIHQATRLQETVESSVQAAQAGARDVNQKVLAAAEANIDATLAFAQQLVRAKDPHEIIALQQQFLQQQLERMNAQLQDIGGAATRTATDMGAAARPKG